MVKQTQDPLPLIDSLPYVKDYLNNEHPRSGDPNAIFISGTGRSTGYKNYYFPKLLDSPNVPPEDKLKIKELLKKPWNPYLVGRHTTLIKGLEANKRK